MEYNYKLLEFLREKTTLSLAEMSKVKLKRKEADLYLKRYQKLEPDDGLGVDYDEANRLEFAYRFENWKKIIAKKNNSNINDITDVAIEELLNEYNYNVSYPKR